MDISPRGNRFLGTWSKKIRMLVFGQGGSLVTQRYGIRLPMQKMWVQSLVLEDPLEEEMATHSSILSWRIPMDRGAWWATVHGVAKSQTRLGV